MKHLLLLISLCLYSVAGFGQNTRIPDFNAAKRVLKKTNNLGVVNEIYCGCKIVGGNKIDRSACGYIPKKDNTRAQRTEAEHIVPYENLVGATRAWDYGVPECKGKKGRTCASKVYGYIEGDLWNLLPSIGELNGLRSNYSVAEIAGESREFGRCDFEIESRKMEPPEDMKPVMAAIYYYMQESYGKQLGINLISGKNEPLLKVWYNKPMPKWACVWSKNVKVAQGNDNRFMSAKCP